jgi:hypothetical protein
VSFMIDGLSVETIGNVVKQPDFDKRRWSREMLHNFEINWPLPVRDRGLTGA